ncbi:Hypothetical protein I595_3553 [Croceitalea dokdonensis DOKDO 023]|uniref:Uncharacterized protein n=1 Tax=Croceitalea dokdonensis DOKDO 023 TaxID=1300341 RepID=A0A0P7ARI9_9FLAO|nr:class I SAM-dependent methyltransferase [Croceitalea dokdonensis]KPM30392.1 Hypothetical protein I595_3553 [Croceitalea dokdonensis DOKDO 023]
MSVLLQKPLFPEVTQKELAEQLEAKGKCQTKLPSWFAASGIYYPNKLHIEQTSSERTAAYKAKLVEGKTLVDITGGLGVDTHFFAQKIGTVFHFEINKELSKIAAHNGKVFKTKNIFFKAENGLDFLRKSDALFDWIFVDPSRRSDTKGKVFLLKDCLPNVPKNLELLFKKSHHILIKTSPLLDISQGISELDFVKEIHVVAVKNEVKELLWVLEKGFSGAIKIKTCNLKNDGEDIFEFYQNNELVAQSHFGMPQTYLYVPNAAIMKSGGFKSIGQHYQLQKLQEHSHLYTSEHPIAFPGRRFKILEVHGFHKKHLKKWHSQQANISTRNFSETVAHIRKKFSIKDGGSHYLFFTTDVNNKAAVIHCKKE